MKYNAPYTAIVGPSGIGKSFSIKQIAKTHGAYTLYVNVRTDNGHGYPAKSTIEVPLQGRREDLEQEWDHFLRFYLEMVQLARENGITAGGLFTLTMEQKYSGFGSETTALLEGRLLEKNGDNDHPVGSPSIDMPVILCFDEARTLLQSTKDVEASSFMALRSAAKRLSFQPPASLAKFFIVMIDTTSRITNFVSPRIRDHSQKMLNVILLEPIWRIDTWSVFAQARMPEPDGSETAVSELFRIGRPLWGAFLEAGYTLGDIIWIAMEKLGFDKTTGKLSVSEDSDARDLALLSTRVNFYVGQASLAERLVSGFLRYVVTIAEDRDGLVSTQPREPLPAYAASRILQNLRALHMAIRTWYASIAGGSVNPGDVGEQVSILMLLFAMDDSLRPAENLPGPIPLSLFWKTLFGNDSWGGLDKALRRGALKGGRRPIVAGKPSFCQRIARELTCSYPFRASDKLTGSTREYFKNCFKDGLAALPLEAPLPGGYIGLAMCLRCEQGRGDYHLSDPAAFKRRAVGFPVAIALGIDVYALHGQGSLEENGIRETFCRLLQRWPDLYPESELKVPYVDRLIYPFNHFE
ncbi:hypothetical protein CMQ_2989 [Grosmannia clavigera kw1407]|uniref:Uncharacterized protein n=1 Tax=Grosmannia clavigera (strain kw1407 / UAMH 11150) TaxID=655863 RepID=F0XH37_GROCL|nr:uncharacterized protein CMQ_2989 [Grosmannia clavigera kw1407]EFX03060.1 hypothetical protein CMQ_2989 [Grosmannia clavigera kw1407]